MRRCGHCHRPVAISWMTSPSYSRPRCGTLLPTLQGPTDFRHLSGPVLPAPAALSSPAAVSHLFSGIERRLFGTNPELRSLLQGRLHVRRSLKRLAKIRIQAGVLGDFGITRRRWAEFIGEVTGLSKSWFSTNESQQKAAVYELLLAAQEIDGEMILETSGVLARAGMRMPASPANAKPDLWGPGVQCRIRHAVFIRRGPRICRPSLQGYEEPGFDAAGELHAAAAYLCRLFANPRSDVREPNRPLWRAARPAAVFLVGGNRRSSECPRGVHPLR